VLAAKHCLHTAAIWERVTEKNVPDNKNCGSVIIFDSGGTVLSFLAMPDIVKPKPINIIRPMAAEHQHIQYRYKPCISVKPKAKWPTIIMNNAPNSENTIRAKASPKTILYFLTGV
jgi:hypothetical protein